MDTELLTQFAKDHHSARSSLKEAWRSGVMIQTKLAIGSYATMQDIADQSGEKYKWLQPRLKLAEIIGDTEVKFDAYVQSHNGVESIAGVFRAEGYRGFGHDPYLDTKSHPIKFAYLNKRTITDAETAGIDIRAAIVQMMHKNDLATWLREINDSGFTVEQFKI